VRGQQPISRGSPAKTTGVPSRIDPASRFRYDAPDLTPPRPSPPALPRLLAAAFACLAAAASPCLRASFPGLDPVRSEFAWTYDLADNRVSKTAEITAPGEPVKLTEYGYDLADNRTTKTVSSGGTVESLGFYEYNEANQLTGWWEQEPSDAYIRGASLSYDDRGNRVGQTLTIAGESPATTAYQWDFQNCPPAPRDDLRERFVSLRHPFSACARGHCIVGVTLPDASQHAYAYRTRRIGRDEDGTATAVSWSGGVSLAEYGVTSLQGAVADPLAPEVEHRRGIGGGVDEPPGSPGGSEPRAGGGDQYRRGPDMGGGIGGLLHTLRDGVPKYNLSNGRGDIVAQSDQLGALTWTASYSRATEEGARQPDPATGPPAGRDMHCPACRGNAFGTREEEPRRLAGAEVDRSGNRNDPKGGDAVRRLSHQTGTNLDRQWANSKEEDPTGLLWEHFRYDIRTMGVEASRRWPYICCLTMRQ